ncbi:Malate dehydrogenase 2, mitochondrial [Linum perenne]
MGEPGIGGRGVRGRWIWRKGGGSESLDWRWESVPHRKVDILGAAGGIGQPLSLLMKLNPLVSNLALYDISNTPDVVADVSHINTRSEVHFSRLLCHLGVSDLE